MADDADGALIEALRQRAPGYDMHCDGPPPPPFPPFDLSQRPLLEKALGHPLPDLFVRLCHDIGNGGFGPGYGLMGLGPGGFTDDQGYSADRLYACFREKPEKPPFIRWPDGVLPICHFGCAIYHCVDLKTQDMLIWEPNFWDGCSSFKTALYPTGSSLADWLALWARGENPWTLFKDDLSPLQEPKNRPRKPPKTQLNFLDKL